VLEICKVLSRMRTRSKSGEDWRNTACRPISP